MADTSTTPGDGLPVMLLMLIANRWFRLREKKLDVEATLAAEKAAQYAARSNELEQRVRVLEQIVTDKGAETAAQIEALREKPRIARMPHSADDAAA